VFRILFFCLFLLAAPLIAQDTKLGEGADLQILGRGKGAGQFELLRDIAFDAAGGLYALDGGDVVKGEKQGNFRVQKFDAVGTFVGEFSVWDEKLSDKNSPQRVAIGKAGNVYVTQPKGDLVQQFSGDGKLLQNFALPRALAVARYGNGVAALANRAEEIVLLPENKRIVLEKRLDSVQDLDVDQAGNFYVLAAVNQIYQFAPDGKLLGVIGSGMNTRNDDGSEPLHSVAVNSRGDVFTMTWGNPGLLTRYDAAQKTVTQREGQFKWADPWSVHSSYVPVAIDLQDRVWIAATNRRDPQGPNFQKYHVSPAILRLTSDYLDTDKNGTRRRAMALLGFKPSLQIKLPYSISYEPKTPIQCEFNVAPANRRLREVKVNWRVFDMHKTEWGQGEFSLSLQDGEAAKTSFNFTLPRYGWFTVEAQISANGERLLGLGAHGGVTPRFTNMPVLNEGDSPGGWEDAPRQMFVGLPLMRLHPDKGLEKFDKDLQLAEKWGALVFAQLTDNKKNFNVEHARPIVERFKNRVRYWELINEPNFSLSPEDYVKAAQPLYDLIHQLDPAAQVLGPAIVSLDLNWLERFYKAGGKATCDILSLHDYEGHESIDPVHWRWKIGALRQLMAQYGDAKKNLWQTERAITGVRGDNFLGPAQAVRVTLHRDLLETLGVAPQHNAHYYLNEGGYGPVPTYLWSKDGPHPGALALRTREAMTKGKTFFGALDFGAIGNKVFMGLRYDGATESTIVLLNLGTTAQKINVVSGGALAITDAWGNEETVRADNGELSLSIGQMPLYIRLVPGQKFEIPKIEWGENQARQADWFYTAKSEGDTRLLNNGVLETIHAGNPNGGTDGKKIWQGEFPQSPQTLEIAFDGFRRFSKMLVFGVRADNAFCALLDYEIQIREGEDWRTISEVHAAPPESDLVNTSGSKANTWLLDNNFYVHEFAPVTTDRIRLVVHRVSYGFLPDADLKAWGNALPPKLMLREIEIY
jgi:hypothetical protein